MFTKRKPPSARLCVVGIGSGGINTMNHLIDNGVRGVDFIAVDTDARALAGSMAPTQVVIGNGRGGGGNPDTVYPLIPEAQPRLVDAIRGADIVFIVGGMGKGTATAVAPAIARIGRNEDAIVVGLVTLPFAIEGQQRDTIARRGVERLRLCVDTLVAVPNDRLLSCGMDHLTVNEMFDHAAAVVGAMVHGLANMLQRPNLINLDIADVRSVMSGSGASIITTGSGSGHGRARQAAESAVRSDLLGITIDGAASVLYEVVTGPDVSIGEISELGHIIRNRVAPDANIFFGYTQLPDMRDRVEITLVAAGFDDWRERVAFQDLWARAHGAHMMGEELVAHRPRREEPARPSQHVLSNIGLPAFLRAR